MTALSIFGSLRNVKSARKTKLAASFVVTVAAVACRKETIESPETPRGDDHSYVSRNGDRCTMSLPEHCPKGASCNPPPPTEIDCPPTHRDAGEPAPPSARPPGKEDWLRVRPACWASQYGCSYVAEHYCAPPTKKAECTSSPPAVTIKCSPIVGDAGADAAADAGKPKTPSTGPWLLESFVYKDGLGACHRVPSFECAGDCRAVMPAATPVPCP